MKRKKKTAPAQSDAQWHDSHKYRKHGSLLDNTTVASAETSGAANQYPYGWGASLAGAEEFFGNAFAGMTPNALDQPEQPMRTPDDLTLTSMQDKDDEDEDNILKIKNSWSKSRSLAKSDTLKSDIATEKRNKQKKEKRDKRNKKKQEAKRAEAFVRKQISRNINDREERDMPPSDDDEEHYINKFHKRNKSKSKGKARNSLFEGNGLLKASDSNPYSPKNNKGRGKSLMDSIGSSGGASGLGARERSKSRGRSVRSRSSKGSSSRNKHEKDVDGGKDKSKKSRKPKKNKEEKAAEDDAYDRLQNMLGYTCGISSTCALATVIVLHLL